jgi:hypothetical protein
MHAPASSYLADFDMFSKLTGLLGHAEQAAFSSAQWCNDSCYISQKYSEFLAEPLLFPDTGYIHVADPMLENRILIALTLIAVLMVVGLFWSTSALRRRRRERLRRRGIKIYGH